MAATKKVKKSAKKSTSQHAIARMTDTTKTYGQGDTEVRALDRVSIEFLQGEFVAIMGPSGSGKSTLLQCLAGLDSISSGTVEISGSVLGDMSDRQLTLLRREKIGFIFQSFNLIPTLSAEENILLPLSIAGKKPDADWYKMLVETLGLSDRLKHTPAELSGGQQQRVAAARALVTRPAIIFADEPSGNLDRASGDALMQFLRRAADEFNQAIVMVTHDAHAASYANRVVFLSDGKIVDQMSKPSMTKILDKLKKMGE